MKNILYTLATFIFFAGLHANATEQKDLEEALKNDPRGLALAKTSLESLKTGIFTIDWTQYDFTDHAQEEQSNQVRGALDSYFSKRMAELFSVKAALSREGVHTFEYMRASNEHELIKEAQDLLAESHSAAWMAVYPS